MASNDAKFEELYKGFVQSLADQPLKDVAGRLSQAISNLILYIEDPFVKWMMLQAPIKICDPNAAKSGIPTMGAVTDGYIYVNPAFWNTVHAIAAERFPKDNQKQSNELLAFLYHETMHFVLNHVWSHHHVSHIAETNNLPDDYVQALANVAMDLIINHMVKLSFPNTAVLDDNGITMNTFYNFLQPMGIDTNKLRNMLGYQFDPLKFLWNELLLTIVECVDRKSIPKQYTSPKITVYVSFGGKDQNDEGKGEQSAHGQAVAKSDDVSRGEAMSDNDTDANKDFWEDVLQKALLEARQAGSTAGELARYFGQLFETRIPWQKAVKTQIENAIVGNNVISAWHIASRRDRSYPGRKFQDNGHTYLLCDTSGSISDEEIRYMCGVAINALKHSGCSNGVTIVPWDTRVYDPVVVRSEGELRRISSLQGGGGTAIKPALDFVQTGKHKVKHGDLAIICTDSCIGDIHRQDTLDSLNRIAKTTNNRIVWFDINTSKNKTPVDDLDTVLVLHRCDYAT